MKRGLALFAMLAGLAVLVAATGTAVGAPSKAFNPRKATSGGPEYSGAFEYGDQSRGYFITECPQAGMDVEPRELALREIDRVEKISDKGDDVRVNTEYSCFPQNETSIAINPCTVKGAHDFSSLCLIGRKGKKDDDGRYSGYAGHGDNGSGHVNTVGGYNDYRTLDRQGFGASPDGGKRWYDSQLPPPSLGTNPEIFDASGDPVIAYDRAGIAYQAAINFNRPGFDGTNAITVSRSTNGGFTWSRPCVAITPTPPATTPDRCGGVGDPRQPGDGIVSYFEDPSDRFTGGEPPFEDKEWMAAGPRPAGVQPVCWSPVTNRTNSPRTARPCDPAVVGVDRIYVTWTRFEDEPTPLFPPLGFTAKIYISWSDDEGRSWSTPRPISASAPFCLAVTLPNQCDLNQFSTPTVHPRTGLLGVAFENYNTPYENQYLFVRSRDGGVTFEGPFFITPVFDLNYPTAGFERPDCTQRGQQQGRSVLTNTCFRVNSGGNSVVDKRGALPASCTSLATCTADMGFADDFYLVMSDNRNGTRLSSNTDVFFFRSTDGGMTWIGPTRVNNDPSTPPADRECSENPQGSNACTRAFGNDQWFPWMDINPRGVMAAGFHDRRLDTNSTAIEWPASRQRPGNYLAWFWGAGCAITKTARVTATTTTIPAAARECLAPGAGIVRTPTEPEAQPGDPVPGQGPAYLGGWANQVVSDVPHNLDYSFRAGIFMGDYNNVAYANVPGSTSGSHHSGDDDDDGEGLGSGKSAIGFWTDSRNGRGSGNPTNPATYQPGRNPACEQADVWVDWFNPLHSQTFNQAQNAGGAKYNEWFLVTPCPKDAREERDGHYDDD